VTLGTVAVLGLYHGFKHLILAIALSNGGSQSLSPDVLLGLLVAATLAAAVAAGMLNRRAEFSGMLLGLGAAAVTIAIEINNGIEPPSDWMIGVPILLAVVGMIGGLAGRLMIPPAPKLPRFGLVDPRVELRIQSPPAPISWWRVLAGSVIVVFGVLYADSLRYGISRVLVGHSGGFGASRLVTWQVSVIATILGGALAGASTRAGLKQGALAGLFAATATVITLASGAFSDSLVAEFWTYQLSLDSVGPIVYSLVGLTVLIATTLGGWLAGHLIQTQDRD
jgi:hypothetical protein